MSHEITLEQAAERAHQAEIVCLMMESYPHRMGEDEVAAIASLLSRLTSGVAAWLIEERAQRTDAEAVKRGVNHA